MSKAELIQALSQRLEVSKVEAESRFDSVFDFIYDELGAGHEVNIAGFGKFSVEQKPSRMGRNPRTGEAVNISARTAVKFKPASRLKEHVNS